MKICTEQPALRTFIDCIQHSLLRSRQLSQASCQAISGDMRQPSVVVCRHRAHTEALSVLFVCVGGPRLSLPDLVVGGTLSVVTCLHADAKRLAHLQG